MIVAIMQAASWQGGQASIVYPVIFSAVASVIFSLAIVAAYEISTGKVTGKGGRVELLTSAYLSLSAALMLLAFASLSRTTALIAFWGILVLAGMIFAYVRIAIAVGSGTVTVGSSLSDKPMVYKLKKITRVYRSLVVALMIFFAAEMIILLGYLVVALYLGGGYAVGP